MQTSNIGNGLRKQGRNGAWDANVPPHNIGTGTALLESRVEIRTKEQNFLRENDVTKSLKLQPILSFSDSPADDLEDGQNVIIFDTGNQF